MLEAVMTKGIPNAEDKGCFDCTHRRLGKVWLCINKDAIKHRKTAIPAATNCTFWQPCQQFSKFPYVKKKFYKCIKISSDT